ncbi:MAG TPA: HEAT repeat domain-containing protein [Amycolatopsis sp.]|nr:HEAT repeat domain-containing protein [Amycolatopsis sp.]
MFLAGNWLFVACAVLALRGRRLTAPASRSVRREWTPRTAIPALRRRGVVRRLAAAEYLGRSGNLDAVQALCPLLRDRDRTVRTVAARSLGQIGSPGAVGPLLDSLTRGGMPQQVVADALVRLGRTARPDLVAALGHEPPQKRAVAAEVLGLLRATDAIPRLVVVLRRDPVPEVKIRATRALGRIGTLSALGPLLDTARPDLPAASRAVAARALGHLGDPAATLRLMLLLSDDDYWVAHNAAEALARLGEAGLRPLRAEAAHGTGQAAMHAREALFLHALRADAARATV